jgi:RNA polymerase subunit RPABC4/transcription elongation factor Spt4
MVFHLKKPCPNCGEAEYSNSWNERSAAEGVSDSITRALAIRCWKCKRMIELDTKRSVWVGVAGLIFFTALGALGFISEDVALWISLIFVPIASFLFLRPVVVEEPDK